jgi:hypothetical protein
MNNKFGRVWFIKFIGNIKDLLNPLFYVHAISKPKSYNPRERGLGGGR